MPRHSEVVRQVEVDTLSLDLNNFRFATEQPDEAMAFNYLFDEEDVMGVANSLIREGYRTNEVPLVVEEGGRYVVLEANRRVSALRALRDPSLVPKHKASLDKLIKRHRTDIDELPNKIYVTVYPDRQSAAPVLARQHIGEDKKRWGLDEQAKFVLAQLMAGSDVKTLRTTLTGINDIVRLVKMGRVRQALKSTKYSDPSLATYAASGELRMSVFEYVYKDRIIRPLLGFEFDQDGEVVTQPETPQELAVLERLLRGIRDKELSTRRVLNDKKSEAYLKLVEELRVLAGLAPHNITPTTTPTAGPSNADAPSQPSEPTTGTGMHPPTPPAPLTPSQPTSVGPNNPDTKRKLVMTVTHAHLPAGLQKRFIELRSIDVTTHPAASAMLMRSVVESSIKFHYTRKGDSSVSGTLSQVVPRIATDYESNRSLTRSVQLLKNALSPKDRPGSGSWFNAASHDPVMVVVPQQVRDAWQELEPLVTFLTQPPPP